MAGLNFSTRMFLPAAVLILLSVTTVAEEAKRCYWCGPLAEQVHRSQRAPSCGQELQETMCDKGYTHCAVIATSPPYVESRMCVKFYQDECYSLYCNSSKTWRMICPCQGNNCNGQNTDRETTAFTTLAKIVGKNKRDKRSFKGAKGFLSSSRQQAINETTIIVLSENSTTHSAIQLDQLIEEQIEIIQSTTMNNNYVLEENIVEQEDSEMQGDQPVEEQIETNEAAATTGDDENVADVKHTETTKTIDDIKADIITTAMTISEDYMTTNNNNNNLLTVTELEEFVEETHASMMPTSIEIELSVVPIQNSKDNLPPPEALQQNVTPAKVSAPTTMGTIEMSTNENHIETTTHSLKETVKNNAEKEMAKNNVGQKGKDKKNGEEQTISHSVCELVLLIHIFIYLAF